MSQDSWKLRKPLSEQNLDFTFYFIERLVPTRAKKSTLSFCSLERLVKGSSGDILVPHPSFPRSQERFSSCTKRHIPSLT